jgi:hypothetical protein
VAKTQRLSSVFPFTKQFLVDVAREQECGAGVPKVVEANLWKVVLSQDLPQSLHQGGSLASGFSADVWEDEAVAAAREDTPILAKMLLACRSTGLSLRTSSATIALFAFPTATKRSTCTSRDFARGPPPWPCPTT